MKEENNMNFDKIIDVGIKAVSAGVGILGYCLGGWDGLALTLVVWMGIDYATGVLVALVFRNSPKTLNGGLDSRVGWKGLAKKVATLMLVAMAYMVDRLMGVEYIRAATIVAFMLNESISISENVGCMGIKMPKLLSNALEQLAEQHGAGEENEGGGDNG